LHDIGLIGYSIVRVVSEDTQLITMSDFSTKISAEMLFEKPWGRMKNGFNMYGREVNYKNIN
jgi:hypothetical protein